VDFDRRVVSRVDLVLTNASARFDLSSCWTYTTSYSCGGAVALDENRTYRFTAKLR
jgi:C1A family cysteine protease